MIKSIIWLSISVLIFGLTTGYYFTCLNNNIPLSRFSFALVWALGPYCGMNIGMSAKQLYLHIKKINL